MTWLTQPLVFGILVIVSLMGQIAVLVLVFILPARRQRVGFIRYSYRRASAAIRPSLRPFAIVFVAAWLLVDIVAVHIMLESIPKSQSPSRQHK